MPILGLHIHTFSPAIKHIFESETRQMLAAGQLYHLFPFSFFNEFGETRKNESFEDRIPYFPALRYFVHQINPDFKKIVFFS